MNMIHANIYIEREMYTERERERETGRERERKSKRGRESAISIGVCMHPSFMCVHSYAGIRILMHQ